MLGSLVIVYPTAHQGGEFTLRHKGREWKFDANALTSSQPSPSLAYVAFYSDLEHEVLKVTDGSRVTLTYNLYLVPHSQISRIPDPPEPATIPVNQTSTSATNFKERLHQLLKSPEFMPKGGTLVFNLAHLDPAYVRHETRGYNRVSQRGGRARVSIVPGAGTRTNPTDDIRQWRASDFGLALVQLVGPRRHDGVYHRESRI